MARVLFIHWHEIEARQHANEIKAEDHEVLCHWSTELSARWREGYVPEAVVISLDRLPSHGRAYAEWLWEVKKRQTIPVVFAGGAPDKIAATKVQFPSAIYCSFEQLPSTLEAVLNGGPPAPMAPSRRRSGTSVEAVARSSRSERSARTQHRD